MVRHTLICSVLNGEPPGQQTDGYLVVVHDNDGSRPPPPRFSRPQAVDAGVDRSCRRTENLREVFAFEAEIDIRLHVADQWTSLGIVTAKFTAFLECPAENDSEQFSRRGRHHDQKGEPGGEHQLACSRYTMVKREPGGERRHHIRHTQPLGRWVRRRAATS